MSNDAIVSPVWRTMIRVTIRAMINANEVQARLTLGDRLGPHEGMPIPSGKRPCQSATRGPARAPGPWT